MLFGNHLPSHHSTQTNTDNLGLNVLQTWLGQTRPDRQHSRVTEVTKGLLYKVTTIRDKDRQATEQSLFRLASRARVCARTESKGRGGEEIFIFHLMSKGDLGSMASFDKPWDKRECCHSWAHSILHSGTPHAVVRGVWLQPTNWKK